MNAVLCSDVHLENPASPSAQRFLRFLATVVPQYERLYILGDLFDVWPGTHPGALMRFWPVLEQLHQLVQKGLHVTYIEGNHDFHLGQPFRDLGIQVVENFCVEEWQGMKVHLSHGDSANPQERGYRYLRKLLRAPIVREGLRRTPEGLLYGMGTIASRSSRKLSRFRAKRDPAPVREIYRKAARACFEQGYDLVVMGHTHLPDAVTFEAQGRRGYYYNLGDWVRHCTYLEFKEGQLDLKSFPTDSQ